MPDPADRVATFVTHLEEMVRRKDLGGLASLRRGLGKLPGSAPEVHRYVAPWLPTGGPTWRDDAYYVVATLFAAWYQGEAELMRGEGSLGRAFRELVEQDRKGESGVERRVSGLLACHREDLPEHLRHAVSRLRVHRVPIDWARLLRDIERWETVDRRVQRRWARDFWSAVRADAERSNADAAHVSSAGTE